jgi:hypothetical protein
MMIARKSSNFVRIIAITMEFVILKVKIINVYVKMVFMENLANLSKTIVNNNKSNNATIIAIIMEYVIMQMENAIVIMAFKEIVANIVLDIYKN